ncbi:hypothetical protein INR49_024232, partial [Caranx melampygus]
MGTYVGVGTKVQVDMKGCAVAEQCLQGSVNFGVTRVTHASKCCTTDLCNTMNVAAYSRNSPNGKKCYYCDQNKCTAPLECMGDEDRCFSLSGSQGGVSVNMKGCVTKNMCGQSSSMAGTSGAEFACCEGDLCNSANSIRVEKKKNYELDVNSPLITKLLRPARM